MDQIIKIPVSPSIILKEVKPLSKPSIMAQKKVNESHLRRDTGEQHNLYTDILPPKKAYCWFL